MRISLNLHKAGLACRGDTESVSLVFDTGASVTLLNYATFARLGYLHCKPLGESTVLVASGASMQILAYIVPDFTIAGDIEVVEPELCVPKDMYVKCSNLLGRNIIERFHYCADTVNNFLYFGRHSEGKKLKIFPWSNFSVYNEVNIQSLRTTKTFNVEDCTPSTKFQK